MQGWEWIIQTNAPWICVLEDDAIPCLHFREQIHAVVKCANTDIISLYLGRGRPDQWQLPISSVIVKDVCFIRSDTLLSTVGYLIRTEVLREMWQDFSKSPWPKKQELPQRMSNWAKAHKKPISYTRPSLVNHHDLPSVTPVKDRPDKQHRTEKRRAWLFDWRKEWDSSYVDLPKPDLRTREKIRRHLSIVKDSSGDSAL